MVFKYKRLLTQVLHFTQKQQNKLNSSEYCLCGAIAWGLISRLYHVLDVSIIVHMPPIVSQYRDHNERYGPEKRGGVQQKFAKISQCQ